MPSALEVARTRYRNQQALANNTLRRARRTWRGLDRGDLTGSWERQIGQLLTAVTVSQRQAASGAAEYHRRAVEAQGGRVDFDGFVNPVAFAGIAADGRDLDALLYQPVIGTKQAIAGGVSEIEALRRGGFQFATLAAQQVRDAGRVADGLATFANPHVGGYYRMLQTPSCARCAILAGKFFRKNAGFQRHPRCDCVHVPAVEADDSLAFDATKAVRQGQVTGLSDRETQAILDGANPSQVVNARRGMDPAGLYTREGTTRLGIAGARILTGDPTAFIAPRGLGDTVGGRAFQRTQRLRNGRTTTQTVRYQSTRTPRPTPEAIYRFATDRDEALTLLRRFGYLL